jgi:hypothetical protein
VIFCIQVYLFSFSGLVDLQDQPGSYFFAFVSFFCHSCLYYLFDQHDGERIFGREMEGCAGNIKGSGFTPECFKDLFTDDNETAIVLFCNNVDQGPMIFAGRDLVTDDFF